MVTLKKDRQSVYYRALKRWIEGMSPWKLPKWLSNLLLIAGGLMALFLMITVVSRFQVKAKTVELSDINKELRKEIAKRKRTQEALEYAKEFSENLINTANVIFVQLDGEGNVAKMNQTAEKITGYSLAELESMDWFEVLVLRDRYPHVWEEFIRLSQKGELPKIFENPILTKSGEERQIIWENKVLHEGYRIVGTISFGMDITERKQAEEALRQEYAFSEAVLESLPGVFYLYDENRRFLRWNKNFTRVTGYTDVEMSSSHPLDFFTAPDKELLAERIQEVFTKGVSDVEADFVAKDGSRTPYYFTGLKTLINGKVCLLGIGIDITERKRAEEELKKHRESLEELVKARTDELEKKIADIEQMNRLFVGRELKMVELKEKIKELEARIGD